MEERVKIVLLGQQYTISIQEILQLTPLIKNDNLLEIPVPEWMNKFKAHLQVLQTSIYYVFVVDHNINSSQLLDFRERCVAAVSNYYISLRMNFQLYEYGYMCSQILSMPLDKAIHILYFMVYARLASRPYINNLIIQIQRHRTLTRNRTIFSNKDYSTHSRSHDSSRPMTVFCDNSQLQIQNFKKQLKKILEPQTENKKMLKKQDYKRYFTTKKAGDQENIQYKLQTDRGHDIETLSNDKYVTVPLKVLPHQNSSVINRLKFQSGLSKIGHELSFKKLQVRRQKFNDSFNGCQRYRQKIKSSENDKQKPSKQDQWAKSNTMISKEAKANLSGNSRNHKRIYEYFHQLVGNIKTTNLQLDSIRFECFNHVNELTANKSSPFLASDANVNSHINQIIHTGDSQLLLQKLRKKESIFGGVHSQNDAKQKIQFLAESTNHNKFSQDLSHNERMKKMPIQQLIKGEAGPSIVTLKHDKTGHEQEQLMLFNRKIKNKFKLQKYKLQYRNFQKAQMFEKVRNIA